MTRQTLVLLIASCTLAFAKQHPKVSQDLTSDRDSDQIKVLVQFADGPVKKNLDKALLKRAKHHGNLELVDAAVFTMPASDVWALADDSDVVRITPDRAVTGNLDYSSGVVQFPSVSSNMQARFGGQGSDVGVAIIDSGVTPQYNFNFYLDTVRTRIVYSQSFVDSSTNDLYGHGTHVAGIAAGMDNVIEGVMYPKLAYWGLAPDASIVSLKALDANGQGSDSAVIAAINRAIQLKSTYNIRVLNLSLGRPVLESYKTDLLCQAVEKAWKAGIVVVVSAGNEGRNNSVGNNGYGTITSPGNDPYVITVGAVNTRSSWDRTSSVVATYSSKGPSAIDHVVKPDILAPGNRVTSYRSPNSTLSSLYPGNAVPTITYDPAGTSTASPYYYTLSGTSMAAPMVTGMVAVMVQVDPALTPDQIKARLMRTAWRGLPASSSIYDSVSNKTYTVRADIFTVGAGLLDCWAAFNDTYKPSGSAASPIAYYDTASKTVKLTLNSTGATSIVWGTTSPFATSVVWGTNVSGSSIIWGTSVVWGTNTTTGFSVVWGTTSPWATSATGVESTSIAVNGEN